MARSRDDIALAMKTEFMSDSTLRDLYKFSDTAAFDDVFPVISLERLLIYIVSGAIFLFEQILDSFRAEIEARIDATIVTSLPWYYTIALEFQYGYDLVFDAATYQFKYATTDEAARIVKYCAVRDVVDDGVTKLKIYYSTTDKQPLTTEQQAAFEAYIKERGAAGIHYLFVSQAPDPIGVNLNVYYDPLVLDNTGALISDGTFPVVETINSYLNGLKYGGVFYASALIDALQATTGVKDVVLESTYWNAEAADRRRIDSASGAFAFAAGSSTINYLID